MWHIFQEATNTSPTNTSPTEEAIKAHQGDGARYYRKHHTVPVPSPPMIS